MSILLTKICAHCKESKPISEFYKLAASKDGLHYRCRECNRILNTKSKLKSKATKGSPKHKWVRKEKSNKHYTPQHARRARLDYGNQGAESEPDPKISLHEVYHLSRGICGICKLVVRMQEASIDHIVPLSQGGSHTWNNVQLTHLKCNMKKSNKR